METLISILVAVLVIYLVMWLIRQLPVDGQVKNIANIIVIIIGIVYLLRFLM